MSYQRDPDHYTRGVGAIQSIDKVRWKRRARRGRAMGFGADPAILGAPPTTTTVVRRDPGVGLMTTLATMMPSAISCDSLYKTCTGSGSYAALFTQLNTLLNQAQQHVRDLLGTGYTGPVVLDTTSITARTLTSMQVLSSLSKPNAQGVITLGGIPDVYAIGTAQPPNPINFWSPVANTAQNAQAVVSALQSWMGITPPSGDLPPLQPPNTPTPQTPVTYTCWDGTVVVDASQCPPQPSVVVAPVTTTTAPPVVGGQVGANAMAFVQQNPVLVGGLALAAYLIFRKK